MTSVVLGMRSIKRLAVLLVAVVALGCAKKKVPLQVFAPEPEFDRIQFSSATYNPYVYFVIPTMNTIYFDTDKYDLREDAVAGIAGNIAALKGFDVANIAVHGHADERHTRLYNLVLGQNRAHAVAEYLQGHGYKTTATTYGESRPVCTESVETCWWQNRRVVLEVILEE